MRPISIPSYISKHNKDTDKLLLNIDAIRKRINALGQNTIPVVSVIIPAYNEERGILKTLSSLSDTLTDYPVEVIVVDNNSSDNTKSIVMQAGARYIFEARQGVENARSTGLEQAKGMYVISGDADTIYSPYWVNLMIDALIKDEGIACTHGKFSFIPDAGHNRAELYIYELIGDIFKRINGVMKDKAMYVYGCSSGYRREQGLAVDGYNHPPGYNEDGYLGIKLREKFGRLKQITHRRSFAWTSSRKFVDEKTLLSRMFNKLKNFLGGN